MMTQPRILKSPGICGGDARVGGTRIPVWVLEQCRRLGMSVREILEDYPTLSHQDILLAWEYAAVHSGEMEEQIRKNRDV